ncbi:lactosylceramide 1,3-N-acetyl-beta-D-glucosaminyltransferase B [Esox lucius]|uniref:Hexosyltransferase n=1 Tax=Esox lucius TaxID=8010 RepID=A0AAY5KL17_ESOLU|nr:lactosylceramide 1,3-N-acetyl-beta-D-glucosaminyltransferase B [Esox lucius]XP_019897862.2 lactosylceramide 1,3-N-acetyl-beta-D-glucosaminyltransferase B [Esox lucius]
MFVNFRRLRRYKWVQLAMTCLVLSLMMVCWEQLDSSSVSHIKSYSYRHLINRYAFINESFTIPRQEARAFRDYRYLLNHPGKCSSEKRVLLLLLVKSSPENFGRRRAIRSTWGNETYIRQALGATVKVVFVLGLAKQREGAYGRRSRGGGGGIQDDLTREDHWHGDLVQQDFVDSFHNLTLKLLLQFRWAHDHCPRARFLMTADDDVFVHMPNVVRYLQDADRRGATDLWVGRVHRGAPPVRHKGSKYYVPPEMYPWASYPDYTAGAAYVVSGDVAEKVYQASLTLNASLYIDDVFMGICASAAGVSPQEHVYFSGEGRAPYHACIYDKMMTSHGHVVDIHQLWKAATDPEVKRVTSGPFGRLYCAAVRLSLLCRPYFFNTYPCKAAFA